MGVEVGSPGFWIGGRLGAAAAAAALSVDDEDVEDAVWSTGVKFVDEGAEDAQLGSIHLVQVDVVDPLGWPAMVRGLALLASAEMVVFERFELIRATVDPSSVPSLLWITA